MDSNADYYSRQADFCRQMAQQASLPEDKAEWRKLAEQWTSLASVADDHAAPATKNNPP